MTCPDLKTCNVPITKYFFKNFCHGKGTHEACHYYCARHRLLKPPMQWLQHLAVEADLHPPPRRMHERTRPFREGRIPGF